MSFRREKHVPRGGPDGGDGGPGGDVWLHADPQVRDLRHLARHPHHRAERGVHGQGAQKSGARGGDCRIAVPVGTQVWQEGRLLTDLVRAGEKVRVMAGGEGGRGNARFVTATRQAPKFAELGEEGASGWLLLTLKLMADAGLAGLPNAGKSLLLRRLSNAKPKVASYPFTTVEPLLGVVEVPGTEMSFTLADVPGLLEGAALGTGLGHEFLAHLERCHLILHMVDLSGYYGDDPLDNFRTILAELEAHASSLAAKPQIVLLNKIDVLSAEDVARRVKGFRSEVESLRSAGHPAFSFRLGEELPPEASLIWTVSAATGEGLSDLVRFVGRVVQSLRVGQGKEAEGRAPAPGTDAQLGERSGSGHVLFRPRPHSGPAFAVRRESGVFVVEGEAVSRLVRKTDFANDEAVKYLDERLERLGVDDALAEMGAEPGDEVRIDGHTFEYS